MKLSKALGWSAANVVVSLAVKLGALVVLSRLLGPEEFGFYNIGMAFVLIGALVAQLGIPTNLVALKELSPELASTGLYLAIASSIVVAFAGSGLFLTFMPQAAIARLDSVVLFATLLVCQVTINVLEAVARRDLRLKLLTVSELGASLVGNLLVSVALALSGFAAAALVVGQLIYAGLKIGILVFAVRSSIAAWPRRASMKQVSSGSFSILVAEVANMAAVQVQRPIVGNVLGVEAAGIWSRVYQIIVLQLAIVVQPLDNLILPVLSRERNQGRDFTAMLESGVWAVSLITLPLSAMTALWAPVMVPILFGPQWTALIVPLQILSPLLFFRGLERIMLSTSRAAGTMDQRAVIQVIQLALILIALGLTLQQGLIAASWGYLIATSVGFGITVWRSYGTTGLGARQLVAAIAPGGYVAGGAVAVAAGWAFTGRSPYAPLGLLLASAVCAIILVAILATRYRRLKLAKLA